MSSSFTPGDICWILILKHSIARVNIKCSCQNSYLFRSYFKNFIGLNFQSCWMFKFSKKNQVNYPLICHISWVSRVGMDSDQQVNVLLSGFVCNVSRCWWLDWCSHTTTFDVVDGLIDVLKNSVTSKATGPAAIFFLLLSSFQLVASSNWARVFIQTRELARFVEIQVFALQSSAWVLKPGTVCDYVYNNPQ